MRISSQKEWAPVAAAIFDRPMLMPSARTTDSTPIRSRHGGAGSEIREGLREADGVISLQHDIGNARWRYTPVWPSYNIAVTECQIHLRL